MTFPHPPAGTPGTRPSEEFPSLWNGARKRGRVPHLHGLVVVTGMSSVKVTRSTISDQLRRPDHVGHAFGPDSDETQDAPTRLDQTIGDLLTVLDTHVGRGPYVWR